MGLFGMFSNKNATENQQRELTLDSLQVGQFVNKQ